MSPTAVAAPAAVAPPPKPVADIVVESLIKIYGGRRAVDGVSFSVTRGETLGLLGPNGAGKTTTMRVLAGFTPATSGRAEIAGHDVALDSFSARAKLGYLPEKAPLYGEMEVRDYLNFMSEIKRHPRAARRAYVSKAIEECGLEEAADRRIGNLSRGYRQRVGLAQAILGDPPVLILDEPTVGLDPRQINDVRRRIKNMAGLRTILISSHMLPEISMTCQKVVVIDRGKIVASGTPEKLVASVDREECIIATVDGEAERVQEILGRVPDVARVTLERRLGPMVHVYRLTKAKGRDPRRDVAYAVVEAGFGLIELSAPGGTLEDVFLQVISSPETE